MSGVVYLSYTLTLEAPVIVTSLSGDPNSAMTQRFVPGSAIRGAMAARLLAQGVKAESEEFQRLILSEEVRYLHAYPKDGEQRAWPAPLSWRNKKEGKRSGVELAAYSPRDPEEEELEESWPQEALSGVGGFVAPQHKRAVEVKVSARIHQQRDREKGRPHRDGEETQGALFAYEAMDAGQVFEGVIQLRGAGCQCEGRLKGLLEAPLLLGRSRRAGYGGAAKVGVVARVVAEFNVTRQKELARGERFALQLASAYVGRHPETGQVDPEALPLELVEALGGQAKVVGRFWGFEVLGGFNRKWRLEVPQAQAVAGGAVLLLEATAPITNEALRQVEHDGLGERRNEGFGRVIFLKKPSSKGFEWAAPLPPTRGEAAALGEEWEWLEERLLVGEVQAELARVALKDLRFEGEISGSLLNRLRGLLRGKASPDRALAALYDWVKKDGGELKDSATTQLGRVKLAQQKSLLAWLQEAAKVESWAGLVALCGGNDQLNALLRRKRLTDEAQARALLEERAAALTVFLIEAVLAEKAKSNRRRES